MDWNLFWSAFDAIGTTFGSLITAVAVIVAVYQYRALLNYVKKCNIISVNLKLDRRVRKWLVRKE